MQRLFFPVLSLSTIKKSCVCANQALRLPLFPLALFAGVDQENCKRG